MSADVRHICSYLKKMSLSLKNVSDNSDRNFFCIFLVEKSGKNEATDLAVS